MPQACYERLGTRVERPTISSAVALKSPIIDGADIMGFLEAALKGSTTPAAFVVPSADGEEDVELHVDLTNVTIATAVPALTFDFVGTTGGRPVKGNWVANHKENGGRRGWIEFV